MKKNQEPHSKYLFIEKPLGTIIFILLYLIIIIPSALAQTTYTVSNTSDAGAGSLRQAILDAEANAGGDIIDFAVADGSTISLSSALPTITEDLDINGLGESLLTISGQNAYGIFHIQSGAVNISDLTLRNGRRVGGNGIYGSGAGAGLGGAILMEDGNLVLKNISANNNSAIGGNAVGFTYNTNSAGSNWFSGAGGSGTLSLGGSAGVALGGNGGNGGFGSGGGSGAKGTEDSPFTDPGNGGAGGYGAGGGAGGGFYDFGINDTGAAGASGSFAGIAAPGVYRANNGTVDNANRGFGGSGAGLGGALFVIAGNVECYNVHFGSNGSTGGISVSDLAGVPIPASANGQAKGGAIFLMDGVTATSRGLTYSGNTAANAGSTATDNADLYGTISNITPSTMVLSANTTDENIASGAVIGTFNAADGIAGYSVTLVAGTGDEDNGNFTIANNQLFSNTIFNFEAKTTHSIRIMYDGGIGDTGEQEFTININDTPDITFDGSTINENMSIGTGIGTFATTDGTIGSTYSLVAGAGDTDNASFTISGSTLLSAESFNFEVQDTYSIRVNHDDGNGEEVFQITINDVSNEIPQITLSSDNIDENLPAGTVIGTMGGINDDDGEAVTYTFQTGATTYLSTFEIVANELKTLTSFNFESTSSYTFTLAALDNVDGFSEKEVTILINDINEDPVNLALSNSSLIKSDGLDSFVATISASDPEGTAITYTIVDVDGDVSSDEFIIDRDLLKSTLNLDGLKATWDITIRAADEAGSTLEKTFTVVTLLKDDLRIFPPYPGSSAPINSTAISVDGMIMGSWQVGSFPTDGAAWVYRKNAEGIWALEDQLEVPPAYAQFQNRFGYHVDIVQDRALVSVLGYDTKSLFFYEHDGAGTWEVTNVLDHPWASGAGDYDLIENRAMAGNQTDVIVYELNDVTSLWEQTDVITSTDVTGTGDQFGYSITQDGDNVIIGAPGLQAAYIFSKNSNTGDWEETAKLQTSDPSVSTVFGREVSLYGDIAFVSDFITAKVYQFEKNADGSWSEKQMIEGTVNSAFGHSIAFNGETLSISDYFENSLKGAVYVYKEGASGDWELSTKLESEFGGASHRYGEELGMDGNTLVVAAADQGVSGLEVNGSVYVYEFNASPALAVNSGLTLDEAASGSVTTALLQVTDNNHLASETTYTLTVPTNGSLRKSSTDMINGDTFTQQDIDDGLITYQHDGSETTSDSFDFTVSDPEGAGIASTTFSITVTPVNDEPILAAIGTQSGDELTEITFTASGSDVDVPADELAYSLDATSTASGMAIDGSTGTFSWTPSESQDGDHTVIVTVTDDGTGSLSSSETIIITVNEVNVAPTLAAIGNQSGDELTEITFTASGTDTDEPANALTYALDATSIASGMTIDGSTGAFSWTPTEIQHGDHTVLVTVTDDGKGTPSASESITITANETNSAPTLATIGNQSGDELSEITFTATGSDTDDPANDLTYSLDATSLSSGMAIDASIGAFTWTPTEAQNGDHTATVTVTDDGTGSLTASETITITVNEVNIAPTLATIGNQSGDELTEITFTASGADTDEPANALTYALDATSIASGMTIDGSTGAFSWTPTETQSGDHAVIVAVTDDGTGTLSASESITITVNEVNVAPTLAAIGSQSGDELTEITFTASGTDTDEPANALTYALDATSIASGMTIGSSTGAFTWTPSESQDGDHTVTVTVTDDGTGTLSASESITISVNEVNSAPVLSAITDQTISGVTQLIFTVSATDVDLPAQSLTFSLDANSATKGMVIDNNGVFTWTPTDTQAGVHSVTITVTDNGETPLSDAITFDIEASSIVTGLKDFSLAEIKFYPNPVNNLLNIDFQSEMLNELVQVSISDLNGKNIFYTSINSEKHISINLSGLKKGIYFISIKSKNKVLSKRFIKN